VKTLAGLAVVVIAALAMVARQPVTASWARYADADASYVGSGISILDGERTKYFDHPGMPLQELAALTFGAQFSIYRVTGGHERLHAYAQDTMLHLDRTRVWFRGWAIVLYLAGALLSYLLVACLLRSVLLGVAAGLWWVSAPGIGAMSIQFRPDVTLVALCVVIAYLIATGAERRDAGRLGLAALVVGVAMTVKIHAAGMLAPLALVTVFCLPPGGWWTTIAARSRAFIARRRLWLGAAVVAWLGLIVLLNARAWPFGPAPSQRLLVAEIVGGLVVYWLAAFATTRLRAPAALRAVVGPFPALMLTLVAAGTALGLSLVASDAGLALQAMKANVTGQGLNADLPLFQRVTDTFSAMPASHALAYAVFAAVTIAVAYRRRQLWPIALLAGAAALAIMAAGRGGGAHYHAPAYVVAGIVALWLVRETRFGLLQPVAVALAAFAAVSAIVDRPSFPTADACAASITRARQLLQPGEVALAPRLAWLPDIEYHTIVETYVSLSPQYPDHFVPSAPDGLAVAKARNLRPAYAVDQSLANARAGEKRVIGTAGRYVVKPVYRDKSCAVASIQPA
jgi:hypothetical protein